VKLGSTLTIIADKSMYARRWNRMSETRCRDQQRAHCDRGDGEVGTVVELDAGDGRYSLMVSLMLLWRQRRFPKGRTRC
jgi:hypothetical protein